MKEEITIKTQELEFIMSTVDMLVAQTNIQHELGKRIPAFNNLKNKYGKQIMEDKGINSEKKE